MATTDLLEVKDWLGRPMRVGSTVVWASSQSHSIHMNVGTVVEIVPGRYDKTIASLRDKIAYEEVINDHDLRRIEELEATNYKLKIKPLGKNRYSWSSSDAVRTIDKVENVTVIA
jgi:hypothetical protein